MNPRTVAPVLAIGWAVALLTGAAACNLEEAPRARVERTVRFAKRILEDAGRNPLASASYQSILEMGGDATSYIAANIGERDDLAPIVRGAPSQPFSVVVGPGPAPHTYLIEGYGENLDEPLVTESVVVAPMPIR